MNEVRLLFIRLRSLGDVILMTPALAAARRIPGCRIGVVVERPFDQLLERHPCVDFLVAVGRGRGKYFSRLQALGRIRKFRPQLTVDLHGGMTSALLTLLSGAPRRVGYAHSRHAGFYNVKVPGSRQVWGKEQVHTVEHQLTPLKYLGYAVEPVPSLEVPVEEEDLQPVREQLAGLRVPENFVLVHPAAAFDTKQWETLKFARLASRLLRDRIPVVMTAGPGQEALLKILQAHCGESLKVIPPLPLRQFAALASLCRLYIGNDTGSTHLAAAQKKPIVVIFGSSDSSVWFPWGVPFELLRSDRACIPCPGYSCLHYDEPRCIRSIEVEAVYEAVYRLL